MGFVVQVALQAVLNMAVVTNTIPNTGISLPFFSSGGTSLMMLLGEMGIVLSVSRGETENRAFPAIKRQHPLPVQPQMTGQTNGTTADKINKKPSRRIA